MNPRHDFLQPGSSRTVPAHDDLQFLRRAPEPHVLSTQREPVKPLPELLVESAAFYGTGALDLTRICHTHGWASRTVPVESGVHAPTCELCDVERLFVDGFARYADLVAKRAAGVL